MYIVMYESELDALRAALPAFCRDVRRQDYWLICEVVLILLARSLPADGGGNIVPNSWGAGSSEPYESALMELEDLVHANAV